MAGKKKITRLRRGILTLVVPVLIVAGVIAAYKLLDRTAAIAADLAQIQTDHRIIDVHEHIQSLQQAPTMVQAMDAVGIGKTVLMGSSGFTLTLNPSVGFTHYDENNEQLLRICAEYPGRFEAWPTMDPRDPQKLDKFAALAARGAKGLKLYLGHGYIIKKTNQYLFHTAALDDPGMLSVYRYCEENFIPVCVHVNLNPDAAPGFAEEFVSMLTQFPDMKVVCPHCMLSSKWPSRIKEFLETFPNLYTDVSFGQDDFLVQALRRFSKNPARYRGLIQQYPNRFMFSTDLVVTEEPIKDQKWITDRFNTYLDMLTKKTFTTPVAPNEVFHGLELPPALLDRVLYKNFQEFAAFRPAHTQIRRSINWSKTGIAPDTNRRPGQSLPPPIK